MKILSKLLVSAIGEYPYLLYLDFRKTFIPSHSQKNSIEFIEILRRKRIEFYSIFVDQGDLFFDIGANLGNRIDPLLKIGARIIAVEPQKTCVKYLKYKYGKKIIIVPKGVGSESQIKTLYISNALTLSSFSEDWIKSVKAKRFNNFTWDKKADVEIVTLDSLINTYGIPDFI